MTGEKVLPTQADRKGAGQTGQIGEGSYKATRDYQKSVKTYLKDADVAADARAAKPANDAEALELRRAEEEAKSHSKDKGG